MTKSRANLKEFFKKGAIPTEANFAELIDSMLNQNDDSISKLPGGALSITAVGADESLLDFNRLEASGPKVSWQIKQNAANKLGFSIQDTSASRLFIDSKTGNVGIGTNEATNKLQVTGGSISTNKNLHTQRGRLAFSGTADDPNHTIYNNYSNLDGEGVWDGMKMNVFTGLDIRVGNANGVKPTSALRIMDNGNVGIGTNTPTTKLEVKGGSISTDGHFYTTRGRLSFSGLANDNNHSIYNNLNDIDKEGAWDGTKMNVYEGLEVRVDQAHGVKPTSALRIIKNGNVGIGTNTPIAKLQVTGGAIMPSVGNSASAGLLFPPDAGGGSGDSAWLRYYARTGEEMTLELGTSNDPQDHIALMPSGNVGIGTNTPAAKLEVKGDFIRKIAMATGLGPEDGIDNGQVTSRVLSFTKRYAETAIRIFYCDNWRLNGNDVAARWEIRINGASAPGGAIYQDKYNSSGNYHEPVTILGYAQGVAIGTHQIQIWINAIANYKADVHTGWTSSRWTIEAQEVWL